MAEKLVPGIPHATRIAIMQQSDNEVDGDEPGAGSSTREDKTVLEHVMSGDGSRNDLLQRIDCEYFSIVAFPANIPAVLSKSFEADEPLEPVRAIRKIRHEKLENQLFLAQKNAHLRSGSRGFQARKDLKAAEAKVQASAAQ